MGRSASAGLSMKVQWKLQISMINERTGYDYGGFSREDDGLDCMN
jgi:hypothetical protein